MDLATRLLRAATAVSAAVMLFGVLLLFVQLTTGLSLLTIHVDTWQVPGALPVFAAGIVGYLALDPVWRRRARR
ncbi:hypothetical protein ABZ671_01245 [Micromonospora sp. NPDC006766]|uniref:hypothetical protein n=1 Tax=Micromonospora sp. NPDC006766 TaxID=3154778 RepID=UPI0033F1C892